MEFQMSSMKSKVKSELNKRMSDDGKKLILGPGEDEIVHAATTSTIAYILARLFGIDGNTSAKIGAFSLLSGIATRAILKDRVLRK